MRLSNETKQVRLWIMAAALAVAALLIFRHALLVREYLDIAGGLGLRGQAPATPLTQIYPAFAADAQTWVRHALALTEGDAVRLRYTSIDNAPEGRPVYWNSAWAWAIAGAGYVDHWLTGAPLPRAIERGTLWLPGVTLLLLVAALGLWAARRAGALAGVVVVFAIVGHARIYEGFFPSYVDHHGLLTIAVTGLVLGAVSMGVGWWRAAQGQGVVTLLPASQSLARTAAVFSAVSGALGLWVSAASVLPPIAITGAAGLVATIALGRRLRESGAQFDGMIWRTWGRVGAVGSLLFYLLEYFPWQIGLRMEANHPLYGLAWLGAGEIIAQAGERLQRPRSEWLDNWQRLVPGLVAVMLAPLVILIGGTAVFVVRDPFLAELHRLYIAEFLPLLRSIKGKGWSSFFSVIGTENIPLFVGLIVLGTRRLQAPLAVWFGTMAALGFTLMAWMQSRWLLNASGSQVALALVLIGYFFAQSRVWVRWAAAMGATAVLFFYPAVTRITGAQTDVANRRVSPADAGGALARDIARVIRASQPEGKVVLLSNPNSSTNVGYYGRFQTLGTLYWENLEGLRAAAAIFSAKSLSEAAVLIRQHEVTHIAMISEENFIAQYHRLLNPGATDEDLKRSFGYQLLVDRSMPPWLQLVPYTLPEDLKSLNTSVLLFRVAFHQTPADALYSLAMGKIAMGSIADGERDLDLLIQRSPQSYQPWLRKGEILFARRDWAAAADNFLQGILRAPESEQPPLVISAASGFFREKRHQEAVRLYQAALQTRFYPEIAAYLAYVLAASSDDALRNGDIALKIAEKGLTLQPESIALLNAKAVAEAELGRFGAAVATAQRAVAVARQRQDVAGQTSSEQRLARFIQGLPWRE